MIIKLARLFRRESVDIVHSHNWTTFLYAVTAAKIAFVPVIIHGEHGHEGGGETRRRLFLKRRLAGRVTRLVAVSSDIARNLIERWNVPASRVLAISNGVDLETFGKMYSVQSLRDEFGWTTENRVILNVGGLRPVKDHPTLFRAFVKVISKRPEARLLIVGGDGGCGNKIKLERLAEALGIREAVHFAGVRHDISQLLALCDVYVNTSLFEGMSNTILEAMASRRPVVATNVGGNPELVEEGVTGYLVPPGDDASLAERLERLIKDPDLSKKLGEVGRKRTEKDHSIYQMVQAYNDMYEGAVRELGNKVLFLGSR